jgi:hypothetical protein
MDLSCALASKEMKLSKIESNSLKNILGLSRFTSINLNSDRSHHSSLEKMMICTARCLKAVKPRVTTRFLLQQA